MFGQVNEFHVNPPFPHLYRHWVVVQSVFGRYLHWWTTAVNEHGYALDQDWLMDDPLPKKGWWEEE